MVAKAVSEHSSYLNLELFPTATTTVFLDQYRPAQGKNAIHLKVDWWDVIYFVCAFIYSLEGRITESVKQLGDLLLAVKGQGQVPASQRNQVAAEADEVLRPLMDLLDGKLNFPSHNHLWGYKKSCLKAHYGDVGTC